MTERTIVKDRLTSWPASLCDNFSITRLSTNTAVPAFNMNNMEQGLAILEAARSTDSPVIIQASRGARSYAGDVMLAKIIEAT